MTGPFSPGLTAGGSGTLWGMRSWGRLSAVLAGLLLVTACATAIPGEPMSASGALVGSVDPIFVQGTDGKDTDQLAATAVTDVQEFWRQTFPAVFGKPWKDLSGGVFSVDTSDQKAKAPPCTQQAADVEGNAFYCPQSDSVAWDRAALLPVLRDRFGDASVVLVLAHELGHAVQSRSGLTPQAERADPERYPTILIETMADCYAGAFVRSVAEGKAQHLRINPRQLDLALGALVSFRDPVGTTQSAAGAHGDAFDRVSAFQDGYGQGAKLCAGMTVQNRTFTQRGFTSQQDLATGGNLKLVQLVSLLTPDLNNFFGQLVGTAWQAPALKSTDVDPSCSGGTQGPVAYCVDQKAVALNANGTIPKLVADIGDFAAGTLIASRYGLAAVAALGKPVDGPDAGKQAVCLAGAYTGSVLARQGTADVALSPGDLDKSVQVLLGYDYAARNSAGRAVPTGFERVAAFRDGFSRGAKVCV
ncbi:neutral zinc metallopeptidase [Kutzneria viridogrisea]